MSLIKCNECGSVVSDKATVCMNCGNPVSDILDKIQENKKAKQKKIIVICLAILIIFCGIFLIFKSAFNKNSFYENIKWGCSYDIAMNKIKDSSDVKVDDYEDGEYISTTVENYLGQEDVEATVKYNFENDKFTYVFILILKYDKDKMTTSDLIKKYTETLTKIYGEPDKQTSGSGQILWHLDDCEISLQDILGMVTLRFDSVDM